MLRAAVFWMLLAVMLVSQVAAAQVPMPDDWEVLYATDFGSTDGAWMRAENGSYVSGTYQLRAEGDLDLIPVPASLAVRDLVVELDVAGLDGDGELGFYFRRERFLSFLAVTISSDGTLTLRRMENGQWRRIVERRGSLRSAESSFGLAVLAQGESLSIFLNGELLVRAEETVLLNAGEVGILLGKGEGSVVSARLRGLSVRGNWREVGPSAPWWPGDYRRLVDLYEEKSAALRESGDLKGEGDCLRYLAGCYFDLGDYRRSVAYYEQSLAVSGRIGDGSGESASLSGLGGCYYSLGNIEQAADVLEKALAVAREDADTDADAVALMVLGEIHASLEEEGPAYGYTMEALGKCRDAGHQQGEARCLAGLGDWYARFRQDYENAINYGEQALRIFKRAGDTHGEALCLISLGGYHHKYGERGAARRRFEEALELLRVSNPGVGYPASLPEGLWQAQRGLARLHARDGVLRDAVADWEEAVGTIEQIRGRLNRASFMASFMGDKLGIYRELVPVLLDVQEVAKAALYAERAKARTLTDMMETAMVLRSDVLPATVQSASGVARDLTGLIQRTTFASQPIAGFTGRGDLMATRPGTETARGWTQAEYDAFLAELERRYPALGDTLSVNAERLAQYCADVTGKLGAGTVALEYFVTDAETILWVITQDGIQTASRIVVSRDDLAQAVRDFRNVVQAPPLDPALPVLSYHKILQEAKPLYDLLIAPVEQYIASVEHLVIIPSDVLFYVPFAALYQCPDEADLYKETVTRCAGGADGAQPTGEFLIERFTLSYAPSLASLYWPLRHEGDGMYTSILSVGNPTGDLLAAQTEATTVAGLFPDATLLLREEGTEVRVKEELAAREDDVVHLSTHGVFDPAMPLLSEVVFREGGGEDGHLYAGEILGLSLSQTELVVMSACQTALPPEISQDVVVGDEIQGLGQALFVAGVPTALLTLWNVNDTSTGELMVEFYQNLMTGQAKAESLAEAQRALLKGDRGLSYRHPYYWAPFVLYGEWR